MPANGLCQSVFRQRAQLWVCVSVCPWVGGCSYCPCFGPLCTSCLNMARLELLSDSFWSSSFPPHRSPSSFSSPKFFASFLCHPSIITPYFRVSSSTPPLLSLLSKPTSHLTPLPFFPFFGGDWSYCFNPLSLPPFPSQSTPFSCFPPIPFLTALGKLVDLVSPRRTQWSPACCPGNSGYSRTNSIFSKERKNWGRGRTMTFFFHMGNVHLIKYKNRSALGKLKCRTLQFQEVCP